MSHSGMTPRDVPVVRAEFVEWADGPGGALLASLGAGPLGGVLAASARQAELYFVSADMTSLARQVGQGLDVYALARDDLPTEHGFLVWDGPPTGEHPGVAPTAVTWMASGEHIVVSLLVSAAGYRDWCKSRSAQAVKDATLVTAGRLVYRGRGPTLPLDGPDAPWGRLDLGGGEEATRTLLATMILINQPVEERRSLHEVEDVRAARSAQKYIRRLGSDPTQTVRTVTLRQSLRPGREESSGGQAARIYRHRWFVKAHRTRQYYPSRGEHQTIWRGPYLVVPPGCEDAPLLGGDRVNVLRR